MSDMGLCLLVGMSQLAGKMLLLFALPTCNALNGLCRFWWEKPGVFTERQREELHRISLSAIITDNTGIATVSRDVFRNAKHPEQFVSCSDIPRLNLSHWQGQ